MTKTKTAIKLMMAAMLSLQRRTSAKQVTEDWKETQYKYDGQGHRRNMLSVYFNSVGIACYMYEGVKYWVQDLRLC